VGQSTRRIWADLADKNMVIDLCIMKPDRMKTYITVKSNLGGAYQVVCQVICQALSILNQGCSLFRFKVRASMQIFFFCALYNLYPTLPFAHLFTTPKTDIFATFLATLRTFPVTMQLSWATLIPGSRRLLYRLFLPSFLPHRQFFCLSRIPEPRKPQLCALNW